MMMAIKFKGNPCTLVGRAIDVGIRAPDFRVVDRNLAVVRLSDYENKVKILTTFPSLDTRVCEAQVKEFNRRAAGLSKDIVILAISRDLPFAQSRFCETQGIDQIEVLSDYEFSSFGINYGVLVKELNLLSRAVFIVDRSNMVRYIQLVGEVSQPPDYGDVFDCLKKILEEPVSKVPSDLPGGCEACEGGVSALNDEEIRSRLKELKGWRLADGQRLARGFRFKDFAEAKYFVDLICAIADDHNHHPKISLDYNKVDLVLWTHAAKGLTKNDFIVAKAIDEVQSG